MFVYKNIIIINFMINKDKRILYLYIYIYIHYERKRIMYLFWM